MARYRISFVLSDDLPGTGAHLAQIVSTAGALSRLGHDVTLLVPHRPGAVAANAAAINEYYSVKGKLEVIGIPFSRSGFRKLDHWRLARISLALTRSADVVVSRRLEVMVLALKQGQRACFDHYKPLPDKQRVLRPVLKWVMTHPKFAGAFIHSEYARQAYLKMGLDPSLVQTVHNGFDPDHFEPRLTREMARTALAIPLDARVVTYSGRMSATKGLRLVLSMAKNAPDVLFLLVGSEAQGSIEQEATALRNVRVIPWQPLNRVAEWMYAADVLIIPPSSISLTQQSNCVLPIKTFGYLAAGRAIFAPRSADTAELFEHDVNACLVKPDDIEQACRALATLLDDPERRERLARNAARLGQTLTWDSRAQKIDAMLTARLVGAPATRASTG